MGLLAKSTTASRRTVVDFARSPILHQLRLAPNLRLVGVERLQLFPNFSGGAGVAPGGDVEQLILGDRG